MAPIESAANPQRVRESDPDPSDYQHPMSSRYPNVIANCLILGSFETLEFYSKRAIFSLS